MNNYSYKIRYVSESLSLLNIISHEAPFISDFMNTNATKYGITPGPNEAKLVEELSRIEEDARAEFADDMDLIRSYFFGNDDYIRSYANILLVNDGFSSAFEESDTISVKEYQAKLKDISDDNYNKYYYQMVKSFGSHTSEGDDDDKDISPADVFDAIYESDISDSDKLKLQHFFLHRDEHFEKVFPLLTRAAKVIKKHEKKLEEFGKRAIAYTKKEVGDKDFIRFFMSMISSDNAEASFSNDCNVYISYMICSKISFSLKGDAIETAVPKAEVGAIFSDSLTFDSIINNKKTLNKEKALAILKLLSDKSKLEILELTKDEAYYGAQLAEKLGLTTATISHHTSALFDQNLLNIEKVDSKIFFKENKEAIETLIRYLEATLLN